MWSRPCWIFDMDGTLTLAVHDFAAFKQAHGLRTDRPILESLALLPPSHAHRVHQALEQWEDQLARSAQAAPGAVALLSHLRDRGRKLSVLTRNTRQSALITLAAAGLQGFFDPSDVLGRDNAAPKPSPEGIQRQLNRWGVPASEAVMIGDAGLDLRSGRAAGTATIFVDPQSRRPELHHLADHVITDLRELIEATR